MIVRIVRAKIGAARVHEFNFAMREHVELIRAQPGILHVTLARRVDAGRGEEAVLFEEWHDPDSVYAWAGRDLRRARLPEAAAQAADEVTVTHFETIDRTGAPPT